MGAGSRPPSACWALLATLLVLGFQAAPPQAESFETTYDFGTVRQGRTVAHRFLVHNAGAQPLQIGGMEFSQPGMTSRAKPVVAPGTTGEIVLEWNTAGFKGVVETQAIVHTSDPAIPTMTLRLRGRVRPPVDLLPFGAVFLSAFANENAQAVLRIVNNEEIALPSRGSSREPHSSGPRFIPSNPEKSTNCTCGRRRVWLRAGMTGV